MNYLTVFHLQATPFSADCRQKLANGLSDIFRAFCDETFPAEEPIDWPPLKLVTVHTPQELCDTLFLPARKEGVLTDDGKNCILFLLDDAFSIPGQESQKAPLHTLMIDGIPLTGYTVESEKRNL